MSDRTPARKLGALGLVLLAIPCVAVLAVPWFNVAEPALFGVPFFYWWQMMWVVLASVFMGIVYKLVVAPGSGD